MNDQQMCAIAQIFTNNPMGAERFKEPIQWQHKALEKANWYNAILKEMEQFGHNNIEFVRRTDPDTKYKPKGDINIHRYCILHPVYFRELVLLTMYPDKRDWSHPIVRDLFEAVRDGSMKKFLDDRVLTHGVWREIKLFTNITSTASCSPIFNFNFRDGLNWVRYEETADAYINVVLSELREEDNLAFLYKSDIFLHSDPLEVKVKFDEANIGMLDFVGEDDRLLNKACRAYEIDIVKDIMTL
jgi:hypothetical protein